MATWKVSHLFAIADSASFSSQNMETVKEKGITHTRIHIKTCTHTMIYSFMDHKVNGIQY